jgi:hypothetical protein
MATYIQGVTDYIPQVQPFKPDLNFYQGVLETKQGQYQAGYDRISNLYGTLLNSELSRTDNIGRRDEFFNKIQTEIQKISGLDLSRSENVNAARKVFQPIVDDKYILKDMSFTKTYRDEQGKAQYFLNCTDEKKCGGKYWDGGVRALDYQRADFVDSSIEESLSFQNPTYTPYVNMYKKAMEFAKDMNFNIKTFDFTPDGRYRITTKNGSAMITGLTDAFIKFTANDPAALAMYNTQAYLQRKDYAYSNAEKFGGDKIAAEKEYLFTQAKNINQNMKLLKEQSEKQLKTVKAQEKVGEDVKKNVSLNEEVDAAFLNMLNGLPDEAANAQAANNLATQSLDNTDGIDYENMSLASLRQRIDAATANEILFSEMNGAAESYAMNTMEQDITEDKYALADYEHQLRMAEKKKEEEDEEILQQALSAMSSGMDVVGGQQATDTQFDMQARLETVTQEYKDTYGAAVNERNKVIREMLGQVINNPGSTSEQRQLAQSQLQLLGSGMDEPTDFFERAKRIVTGRAGSPTNESAIATLIDTDAGGLWANSPNVRLNLRSLQDKVSESKQILASQDEAERANNMAVLNQMYIDGGDDIDLFFKQDGTKRSLFDFEKLYNERHPVKDVLRRYGNFFTYPIDNARDTYEDLEEQYKKTFNSGKVQLRTPYGTMGGDGEQGLAVKNKVYTLDPANIETTKLSDGTVVLTGVREKMRDLYYTDIAKVLTDPTFGNSSILKGNVSNITADDIEDADDDVTKAQLRGVLSEILRSAFTTKYDSKDVTRPVMEVTRAGIIAGDPNKVGVTFTIPQTFVQKYQGSENSPGFTKGLKDLVEGGNQITVVMDRSAVQSRFFKELDANPVEMLFNNRGALTHNAYEKEAGTVTISKGASGYINITSNLKSYDPVTKQFYSLEGENNSLNALNDMYPNDTDISLLYQKIDLVTYSQAVENMKRIRSSQR